ncbi:tubulin-specific chaperone A-like [Ctenocephalides felis]|uniref:tubulin-specific chaperone A-like n=1 Tax=Ctenocephalides felis TaxID=7515 RepID=UPI000E6E4631|nr:tubulin-specific chaperone A-like [Ctenocephalides felis]
MADPRLRQIKIQTGIVKRLTKEADCYEKEAEQQKKRVISYKDQGKGEYEIRKQEEVLQEALMMVPDCRRRLQKAYEGLKSILDTEKDLVETEEFKSAEQFLLDAQKKLPPSEGGTDYC